MKKINTVPVDTSAGISATRPVVSDPDDLQGTYAANDPGYASPPMDEETASGIRSRVEAPAPIDPTLGVREGFVVSDDTINKLNECLRGELSAVETYDLAMRGVRDLELVSALRELRDSHDHRVTLLRDRIRACGAEPVQTSGAWGAFARILQRGADLFGDGLAMSALEEGEDRGLRMYSEDMDRLDAKSRDFVVLELLPEQERTHELCGALQRFVKAA
jgi:demethoxyubiquinone hydroxylase (CLK1/Coq7/Cat5 family)